MENNVFLFIFVIIFLFILIIFLIALSVYFYTQLRQVQGKHENISKDNQIEKENIIKDYENRFREAMLKNQQEIEKARRQSVAVSRSTIKGQIAEQLAPLLPGFSYTPSDSHFIGDPIDYVVFNGYTDFKDNQKLNDDFEVVIIDIKHNKSNLTAGQKLIATAISEGKVRFEIIRIQENGEIEKQTFKNMKKNSNI